jgi:disulfide bond formation protein DsbB
MTGWNSLALALAVAGAAGSLWLSLGMNLEACPLCFYQRTFILAVVGVLATGLLTRARNSDLLPGLAIPAAVGGLGVALFHVYLELTGTLECPAGLLGLGTAPQQSLAVFLLLLGALLIPLARQRQEKDFGFAAVTAALVLGAFFALGTIKSAPPMKAAPTQPYEKPLDVCRPPYRAA